MLIYGYYAGLNSKIMLFQMNKLNDVNKWDICIEFSRELHGKTVEKSSYEKS